MLRDLLSRWPVVRQFRTGGGCFSAMLRRCRLAAEADLTAKKLVFISQSQPKFLFGNFFPNLVTIGHGVLSR